MTSKTDARIRAAYEPVGAPGEPLDQLIARGDAVANEIEDGMWGKSNDTIDLSMRHASVILRELTARLEALRAAGAARPQQNRELLESLSRMLHPHGLTLGLTSDSELKVYAIPTVEAAGDARRPQLHQKAIDRLTALHRHMGNVRSLLDRVQATRTPDHDAQDRTVGDWQEQVTLAIGELTEAAGAPADGAGPQEKEMQFRKKPVVIEAEQFNGMQAEALRLRAWVGNALAIDTPYWAPDGASWRIEIPTLEGRMVASPGDWIIKGVKGEFYPCKPDIFAATYEPAADGAGTTQCTGDEVI